jgi:drug/metabolite transporter (DMT)-like permease
MPDAGPLGPATVIVMGLLAAISFGTSDFAGGLTSRRVPLLGVSLTVQVIGTVVAIVIALAVREPLPQAGSVLLGVLAGLAGVVGILGLYQGLAVGRMGVVAPVAGVLGAAIPVLIAFVSEGPPAPSVAIGIAVALVAVVVVSRSPSPAVTRSGVEFAIVGGVGIGLFNVTVGRLPPGLIWWPILILKITAVVAILVIALVTRRPVRVPQAVLPAVLGIAAADMGGNSFYVLATQTGRLDIAAVLASLYPVMTVILAILVLREHVSPQHALGIAAAAVAIALIAAGSPPG